jgi:predicted alpha-1,2-mannosidase
MKIVSQIHHKFRLLIFFKFAFFICFSSSCIFSQVKNIKELHQNQDKRKEYIDLSKSAKETGNYTQFVNPFIGTGGHGHTFPGAVAPFGMIQLSPDTRHDGWDGCSGYHYSDSIIYGFSHTHLSGTGVADLCDVLIVPQQGKALLEPGYLSKNGYGSKFKHDEEDASPGFYKVKLLKDNIDVRLAVTERAGIHEYTFNQAKGTKYLLIDLDHRDQILSADFNILNKSSVSGYRNSSSWATNQQFFFKIDFETPFVSHKQIKSNGKNKLLLEFHESTKKIVLKIGISSVDTRGAQKNLESEIKDWNLDYVRSQTVKKWNDELSKIQFESSDMDIMTKFYTALYHSYIHPSLFSDVDGRYRGMDRKIHQLQEEGNQYTIFSLWDTYRATHPLFTLTQKKKTGEFIQTFLRQYQQNGKLPVWELVGNETNCMIGYHSVSVILDAYRKGIQNFDHNLALEAMQTSALVKENIEFGYIDLRKEAESVSKTLEYAYDDWCVAEFAKELGKDTTNTNIIQASIFSDDNKPSIYNWFTNKSFYFLNLFDPSTKFMRAKRNGQWYAPFDPSEVNFNYTEANSWQYSLAVPHQIPTLTKIFGGKDSLQSWLDRLFTTNSSLSGRHQVDITGLIGQYAHGNEPSHHMAYLYNYTNQPHKTQEKVDEILREMYHNAPDGLSGNEDCGQMSAWYVFSAMGFYPVCPGKPYYSIGRPLHKQLVMHFENGKKFTVKTLNNSPENKYIQSLTLNMKPYKKLYLSHSDMVNGGELIIVMGNTPNYTLKNYELEVDMEESIPEFVIPVPYFTQTNRTFSDSISTEIKTLDFPNLTIRYTTDGTDPTINSPLYSGPLTFHQSTKLTAKTFKGNQTDYKNGIFCEFVKTDASKRIELLTQYANQYAAGGSNALIDGLTGSIDYRCGDWQGYEGIDAKGMVHFDSPKTIENIKINCLEDTKSWIFKPIEIILEYSNDGVNYTTFVTETINQEYRKEANAIHTYTLSPKSIIQAKSIRFTIKNRGICPENHLGKGEKAWIFIDEISFIKK